MKFSMRQINVIVINLTTNMPTNMTILLWVYLKDRCIYNLVL